MSGLSVVCVECGCPGADIPDAEFNATHLPKEMPDSESPSAPSNQCKHHEVCKREEYKDGLGYCILHDPDMDKDREAFDVAFAEHRKMLRTRRERVKKEKGDDYQLNWDLCDDFRWIVFLEKTRFIQESFADEGADFRRTRFGKVATFIKVSFGDRCWFSKAEFEGNARFSDVHFSDGSDFESVKFGDRARFEYMSFGERSQFKDASFGDNSIFRSVVFGTHSQFENATLGKSCSFIECSFGDSVVFKDSDLGSKIDLSETEFEGSAYFTDTQFGRDIKFNDADFFGYVSFSGCTFGSKVTFKGSEFWGEASFAGTNFNRSPSFEDATFRKRVSFAGADIYSQPRFISATFHGLTNFCQTNFGSDALLSKAKFMDKVEFNSAVFGTGAFFNEVHFESRTTFTRTELGEDARFWDLTGRGEILFADSMFRGRTSFLGNGENPLFREEESPVEVSFMYSRFSEPKRVSFNSVDFSCVYLLGVDVREMEFTDVAWPKYKGGNAVYDEIEAEQEAKEKKTYKGSPYAALARLYRRLKQNYEDQRDFGRGGDFHFREKEMMRRNPETPRRDRIVLSIYRAVSGYGERYWAGGWFLGLIFICSLLLISVGLKPGPEADLACLTHGETLQWRLCDFFQCLLYSIQVAFVRPPDYLNVTTLWGEAVKVATMILGPVLLGLFGLAIRQRVRR